MEGNRLYRSSAIGTSGGNKKQRKTTKEVDRNNVEEDLMAQGMNMREAVDNSRKRRNWRSLVEASSSANA